MRGGALSGNLTYNITASWKISGVVLSLIQVNGDVVLKLLLLVEKIGDPNVKITFFNQTNPIRSDYITPDIPHTV